MKISIRVFVLLFLVLLGGCAEKVSAPSQPGSSTERMGHESSSPAYEWQMDKPSKSYQANTPIRLSWDIIEPASQKKIGDFDELHTKLAHLIIVSEDLGLFEHIHPDVVSTGHMQVTTTLPKEGNYRLFLQFAPKGKEEVTLDKTLQVGNAISSKAKLVPDESKSKAIDGYIFRLKNPPTKAGEAAMVELVIEKNGIPVSKIQPYLGAGGHAVVISEDARRFLHVHPMSESVNGSYKSPLGFHTTIPKQGLYKLWIQVKLDNKVRTVDFTFESACGSCKFNFLKKIGCTDQSTWT